MGILRKLWRFADDKLDDIIVARSRWSEIEKFKDKRRVSIYSGVNLTIEQTKAIDKLYIENYGERIPYTWHRHFTAYTGKFDVNYFPELLYIPEFEYFINLNKEYCKVFSDKNILPFLAHSVKGGVKVPKTYLSRTNGVYRNDENTFITNEQAEEILNNHTLAFAKPSIDSSSGQGCIVIDMCEGRDRKSRKYAGEILNGLGNDFVIQECIKCHKSISNIYSGGVNTFRIITYRWKDKIEHMPVIMRIGKGGSILDNAHAGGMFIAVSNDGVLHEKAFTEFKKEFTEHPDTKVIFHGYQIEYFEKMVEKAIATHEAIPQIGCVNWDFTIDVEGNPVLIEANLRGGSVWLIEMAHGCGAFGEKTPEVLRWIRLMKKLPKSSRKEFSFGKMK